MTSKKQDSGTIVVNKKARFDYFIEDEYEAGIALEGWEVKSLRAGKVNIADAHVIIKHGEAWLLGAQIQPLPTTRLLWRKEIGRTVGFLTLKTRQPVYKSLRCCLGYIDFS